MDRARPVLFLPCRGNLWVRWQSLGRGLGHASTKLPTGGFEGALLLLGVVVIEQGSAILDENKDKAFDRHLSESRRLVEVTDDLTV